MTVATLCRRPILRLATPPARKASPWCIVLAAGEGARMNPMADRRPVENRPKQYGTFVGSRSMFQRTVDRARCVAPEDRILSVIGHGHRRFLPSAAIGPVPGMVIEEPNNLGTAPGIFLSLAHILAIDPEACVVLLPSDHFVNPEHCFVRHVMDACKLVERQRDQAVLLAAVPDRPGGEFGWIQPRKAGRAASKGAMRVLGFRERPGLAESCGLFEDGCLWNTMIMVARARTLWEIGRRCLPEMMNWFDAFLMLLRDIQTGKLGPEMKALAPLRLYKELSPADFSRDILQQAAGQFMVLPMEGVEWCDWACPERVTEALARLNRPHLFPAESGAASAGGARPAFTVSEIHA